MLFIVGFSTHQVCLNLSELLLFSLYFMARTQLMKNGEQTVKSSTNNWKNWKSNAITVAYQQVADIPWFMVMVISLIINKSTYLPTQFTIRDTSQPTVLKSLWSVSALLFPSTLSLTLHGACTSLANISTYLPFFK